MQNYIIPSLETHLFFARIMKEHALFLKAGFPGCHDNWLQRADWFIRQFEDLLLRTLRLADNNIGPRILNSCELITDFTIPAEQMFERLIGIHINDSISPLTKQLTTGTIRCNDRGLFNAVHQLNRDALPLIRDIIDFKESVLKDVRNQNLFTMNYPLLIEHIVREARLYHSTVEELLLARQLSPQNRFRMENFWNQIMMEHSLFIRGLLDPCEEELISTAHNFAKDYRELLQQAKQQDCRTTNQVRSGSLEKTKEYREFKTTGTSGILGGSISSVILPLLADHVLREANHYIRILEDAETPVRCICNRA